MAAGRAWRVQEQNVSVDRMCVGTVIGVCDMDSALCGGFDPLTHAMMGLWWTDLCCCGGSGV